MRRYRTALLVLFLLAIALGGAAWLMRGAIASQIMARAYVRAMGPDPLKALPDALSVGLCGSGSPMPNPTRAGPCTVVVAGRQMFVIDSGTGSTKNLSLMNLPPAGISAVFITHVIPPLPLEALEGPFLGKARKIFHGVIRVGRDGDFFILPVDGTDAKTTNRLRFFL